ncbi:MAG: tyrosine--tRNA ligase [Candidatus Buchananbacteria bacterium CG10_big_fil_rev_8_21_14_0_10_42_9]|uniref:Tyrosine--tRNA ligase n=1 Tax=Candidatus Buchananbacteria bacterium CG10_big_fil_rev_8_21_14_0_10_42_9 TaxID=1974526 RepID=A0A2H0W0V7_9BACT|nr:MAG: tyrosine--tRNA ligase [Candidatus Buchananbacteria bacterium CG10_big_fil_rev_8_21_14_0_10_42_9]
MIKTDEQKIKEVLTRGVENVYPAPEVLEKALKSGKKLRIYTGIDPTGKLHIGHGVVLLKLHQLQELGHEIIVLIGDFTGRIGDPTDKQAVRQKLSRDEVRKHSSNYKQLVTKILGGKRTKVRFLHNEQWTQKLKPDDLLELASNFTVAQLLERDMFQERIKKGKEIYLHEFLYPIFQAYDAVTMDVDMQVGGNDQTFNMLAGRTLMSKLKNKEKFVLTTKLLVDPTGKKMGKTEGNLIALTDEPADMYGKVMSWPDELIGLGFELCTAVPMDELAKIKADLSQSSNPKSLKMRLAKEITTLFHDAKVAAEAEKRFETVHVQHDVPEEIDVMATSDNNIIETLVQTNLASSKSEARRLVEQRGVKVNGEVVDENHTVQAGDIVQRGKRQFVKIK